MLTASMAFYKKSGQLNRKALDWDNKWPGVRLLLARLTQNEELARESLSRLRKTISSAKYTPKGLIFIQEWGPLRHAANYAFLAFVSTKLDIENSEDLLEFGKKQMFYIYGDAGRSFIVGFGKNYPTKPHHRCVFLVNIQTIFQVLELPVSATTMRLGRSRQQNEPEPVDTFWSSRRRARSIRFLPQ